MIDTNRKKRGCFRTGCLSVLLVALFFMVGGWLLHRWNERLPSRFVLRIPVTGSIDERSSDPAGISFPVNRSTLSLEELLVILDRARTDRRVDSVLLQIDGVAAPSAKIQELRNAIETFRRSGKRVTAFLNTPEDKDYQLAVACDTIIVRKGSWLLLDGLKSELFFFAGPLEKLGVGFQAAQWKKYKSGVEPFTRSSASPENIEETNALLDDAWGDYLDYVSRRRSIDREDFRQMIDSLAVIPTDKALANKLVDRVLSPRQLEKEYAARYPDTPSEKLFVNGAGYLAATGGMESRRSGDRIAILVIDGMIVGDNEMSERGSTDVATVKKALQTALDDPDVKAIVLRIDSPGGDAFAASSMLEMLEEAKKKKPMVASMSGVAASGGYMVALAADRILAQPMTVTGSIGVFALKPDLSGVLEKSGIRREVLTRGRFADAYTPYNSFDDQAFRKFVDIAGEIYHEFTGKVAEKRHLSYSAVEAVAGGRVWSGKRALEAGLIDRIGGLSDAVQEAGRLAGLDKSATPGLFFLPEEKTWIELLMEGNVTGVLTIMSDSMVSRSLGQYLPAIQLPGTETARFLLRSGSPEVLAIQPFELEIK